MILLALVILFRAERGGESRIPGRIWAGLIVGSLILITGFILDYTRHMLDYFSFFGMLQVKNPEVLEVATSYIPDRFPWWIFILGEVVILASTAWYSRIPTESS
jgi:hypothetical protein